MPEADLIYPVTAVMSFAGTAPVTINFESVEQWTQHISSRIDGAVHALRKDIVPCDENKTHQRMFDIFNIEFKFEKTGRTYGVVTSQMRMPVPAVTMVQ